MEFWGINWSTWLVLYAVSGLLLGPLCWLWSGRICWTAITGELSKGRPSDPHDILYEQASHVGRALYHIFWGLTIVLLACSMVIMAISLLYRLGMNVAGQN